MSFTIRVEFCYYDDENLYLMKQKTFTGSFPYIWNQIVHKMEILLRERPPLDLRDALISKVLRVQSNAIPLSSDDKYVVRNQNFKSLLGNEQNYLWDLASNLHFSNPPQKMTVWIEPVFDETDNDELENDESKEEDKDEEEDEDEEMDEE